ncbi:MAG: prepilin-type N-terminal cleavage/methylation domain-containing protein [Candidatus Fermentibacteraceae bacterium]|nr:prepilin-type N-terminal cleavage/methylation domain-containing protein [Candidatus Fermentibacteraceae bacterium]
MKKGFTLVELVVASVVILVVLSALFVALLSFVRGGKNLELQDGALTLARVEIAEIERREEVPAPGTSVHPDTLWGNHYKVETTVGLYGENAVDVSVAVTSGDSVSIELARRFYMESNTNRQELL